MTELINIDQKEVTAAEQLDELSVYCQQFSDTGGHDTLTALKLAHGMQRMREILNGPILNDIMQLQGTAVGFRTDKQYSQEVIADVVIEAMVRGYRPTGNEFNVIAGRFYPAQAGLDRKVREFPGISDLVMTPGIPAISNTGALVPYKASWKLNGESDSITCIQNGDDDTRIPIRVNSGQGPDAVLGKARRKMLARILEKLTGRVQPEGDVEDMPTVEEAKSSQKPAAASKRQKELTD